MSKARGGSDQSFSVTDGNGNSQLITIDFPRLAIPPPIGYAVDCATVTATPGSSQAQITLALAVFGNNAAMQRCSYTAYIVTGEGGIIVDPPVDSM